MTSLLFDYSEFLEDWHEHALGQMLCGPEGRWTRRKPDDPARFFGRHDTCPFCSHRTAVTWDQQSQGGYNYRYWYKARDQILQCSYCGWWAWIEDVEKDLGNKIDERYEEHFCRHRYAIAKTFAVDSKYLPTQVLANALAGKKSLLYEIHPSKLEQLAQRVFAEQFQCEVRHVGRSNDGGIDLIIVQSGSPILVQVKRRSSPGHVEGVEVIRDLIGAMYINDVASGVVLSTANRYSRVARATVNRLLAERRVRHFQLIDYPSFCDMLDISATKAPPIWNGLLKAELTRRARWEKDPNN